MSQGRMRKAVDKSIDSAVTSGDIDLDRHAAPIAMLRYMADKLDSDSGETPMMRYVTPASFLSYCDSLGLVPKDDAQAAGRSEAHEAKMTAFRDRSKFARAANG